MSTTPYLFRGHMHFDVLKGYWADCGESFHSVLRANNLVADWAQTSPSQFDVANTPAG